MPIIDLQRRLVEAGRIRAGDRANGKPHKLAEWRLTSKDRQRLEAAAGLWGGTVQPWKDHAGEFELYTDTAELPIMLLPDEKPSQWYELWSRGGCQRRCDGVTETLTDKACLCDADDRECKLTTRLNVLLPDLPGVGSWLLSSTGENAARELLAAAELLGGASAQGVFIPARLRLEQRVKVKEGQTRRFAVPVIDIDVSLRDLLGRIPEARQITGSTTAAAGAVSFTPIAPATQSTVTLREAIEQVEQQEPHRGPRSAPPIPEANDAEIFETTAIPVPDDDEQPEISDSPFVIPTLKADPLTEKQFGMLNAIVGQLRRKTNEKGDPWLTTEQLWLALATERGKDMGEMVAELGGLDGEGVLHWSPLRDSLTKSEAHHLIDRLQRYEGHIAQVDR